MLGKEEGEGEGEEEGEMGRESSIRKEDLLRT